VIPTKIDTAPHPGEYDDRKSCTYSCDGRGVSDTWIKREEEEKEEEEEEEEEEDSSSAMLVCRSIGALL